LNRSIRIEAVDVRKNPANNETHLVSVDVIQSDRFSNAEITREKALRVFLEMTARPQIVHEEELYTNPLGIVVLNMTIKERS
jgi:type IV secretion system protein VirB8